ncbi:MAG: YidC/Oxa1 family membrane protein insertase [Candidatus Gallimonas sp.]
MLSSLLDVGFNLLEQGYKIGLDALGQFAKVIIEGVGIIGVGIIVFTLVLKAITLPFDIYQRIKMRKQNLIMKEMQPELEKLQQQYANDKTMYQQKMAELYKKNGYGMLSACLPMILSLVILIVAFQGFRAYSQYANLSMYENMSAQYNAAILEHGVNGLDYRLSQEDVEDDELTIAWAEGIYLQEDPNVLYTMYTESRTEKDENGNDVSKAYKYMRVESTDESKYLYYVYSLETKSITREYRIDVNKLNASLSEDPEAKAEFEEIYNQKLGAEEGEEKSEEEKKTAYESACYDYVVKIGATAAAEWYRDGNDASFLWVKNVWYPDVSYNHPIQQYSSFKGQLSTKVTLQSGAKVELSSVLNETQYNNLTSQLTAEKSQPNGYFILIILSIGLMVLSQFVSMRSSKETNKYQTVDGSGGSSQKIMMIMMPLIYAIFAFMYSAAFSIYMTMSSFVSLIVTLLSNLVIGRVFKKKEEKELTAKYERVLPWQKNQETNGKKEKKNRKK